MQWADLKHWLKLTMGMDAATVGPMVIERAVQNRMAASAQRDLADYCHLLRNSSTEQQELIEAVIVPETSFFRDSEAFAGLLRVYDAQWCAAHPNAQLRVLSIPCSSGEEPYTIAMALLDAGFPADRFRIDAVDISRQALAKARHGLYGSNSFRGRELPFRDRHFQAQARGWQLSESVRRHVRFQWGNVLDVDLLPGEALYDAIFCRNLLIYFDQDTQTRVVGVLARLLRAKGLIFVGPSETGLMLNLGFVPAQMPMAFAFRKPESQLLDSPPPLLRDTVPARAAAVRDADAAIARQPVHCKAPAAATSPPPTDASLERAQKLADAGRFSDAATVCEAHLKLHGPSPKVLYLMGLVDGARGHQVRAEDWLRKTLYLEPGHEEALMHLAMLLESKGDIAGGRVLRLRAKRHRESAG